MNIEIYGNPFVVATVCETESPMSTISIKKHSSGLLLDYGEDRIVLDTGIPGEVTLLSHSHFDHLTGVKDAGYVYATRGTFETIDARANGFTSHRSEAQYNQPFFLHNVKVTPYNAGHVLGSTMFLMEFSDGLRVLYTGDFNVVDSIVHTAAIPVLADVLIMEATYGTPDWVFPSRPSIHSDILDAAWNENENARIPVFKAYSLGKAQEAIMLLQDNGFAVVSGNYVIDSVCAVYSHHGANLNVLSLSSPEIKEAFNGRCAIVSSSPQQTKSNLRKYLGSRMYHEIEHRLEKYSLSGWTLAKYSERGFPLSAHSDFTGLLSFVDGVSPRIVYCFTDNASVFSHYLMGMGVNSVPLE